MANTTETLVKLALLPKLLSAAQLLKDQGLIDEEPADVVKQYVQANPDINALLATKRAILSTKLVG